MIDVFIVGVGVVVTVCFLRAVCGCGVDLLEHLGALASHLDESEAAETEVDVLVIFEDMGIVNVGVFEGSFDVSFQYCCADACVSVSTQTALSTTCMCLR